MLSSFYVHCMLLSRMLTWLFIGILNKKFSFSTKHDCPVPCRNRLILDYLMPDEFNPLLRAQLLLRNIWLLSFHLRLGLRSVCFLHSFFQSLLHIDLLSRAYYKHNALFPPCFNHTKHTNYVIPLHAIFSILPLLASSAKALPDLKYSLFHSCRYFESWSFWSVRYFQKCCGCIYTPLLKLILTSSK